MSTQGKVVLIVGIAVVVFMVAMLFGNRSASADTSFVIENGVIHACLVDGGNGLMGDGLAFIQGSDTRNIGNQNVTDDCPVGFTEMHWNEVGPVGPVGPQGEVGAEGPEGPEGPAGANASGFSVIGGGGEHNDHLKTHQVVYFPMFHGDASTVLGEVEQVVPVAGSVSRLNVRISDAPRNGEWTFTIVGGSSPLSCTIAGAATSCSVSGPASGFAAGDLLALKAVPDFSPKGGVHVRWTAAMEMP